MLMAISLWEPFATAMALELKRNETRSWRCGFRGELAICAAKRRMTAVEREIYEAHVKPHEDYAIPYGKVVCVVTVHDIVPVVEWFTSGRLRLGELERALGDYTPGRFAWRTGDCRRLHTPVPVTGQRGLFSLPASVEQAVRAQLANH